MATVLGNGQAHELMEVDFLDGCPGVHVHFLTPEGEVDADGFRRVELCCHGCGASTLVVYKPEVSHEETLSLRDSFVVSHQGCSRDSFKTYCPNYRSSFKIVTLSKFTSEETSLVCESTLRLSSRRNQRRER